MRINKYIASCGIASRRKAEEIILGGRIKVNGSVVKELSFNIDEEKDADKFGTLQKIKQDEKIKNAKEA
ncbi:S4 domain protein, partial [Clostridioides difficile Y184]